MFRQTLITFSFLWFCVFGQYISDESCPTDRPIQQNFDINKYTGGVWYEILRYDVSYERGCDCGFAKLILNDDSTVKVRNCCKHLPSTSLSCSIGQAILSEPDHVPLEGKLNVMFGKRANTQSNYWVLSTDYENYSIVFYCKNIDNNKSAQLAWVLSRQPELNPSVQSFVYSLLDKHFVRSEMYKSVQSAEICEPRDK